MNAQVSARQAMVTLADLEVVPAAIAATLQCAVRTVRRWLRRFRSAGELTDRPRSGRPPLYTPEITLRLVAFYCQTEPLPGVERWTLRWAVQRLKVEPNRNDPVPSKSTLQRILCANDLRPHRSSYFLNITDPDFFPKMEHLLELYRNPPRNLMFFDECSGLQILKRLTPDWRAEDKRRLEEFEYIRNGTIDVLAFFNHADGKVYLECQADHTTETFLAVFRRQAQRFSSTETLHYVMDNLSTHRSYSFCQLVAELSGVDCPSEKMLHTATARAQWLGDQSKRIVVHFTPFHGSWLNMVETWFGIMKRHVLGESFGSPDRIKAALEAFTNEWNILLAHPFRWSYDGKGLHDKAVRRFTATLHKVDATDLPTLTKMMKLMTNLLADYFSEVTKDTWLALAETFGSKLSTINELIRCDQRPRVKERAAAATADLAPSLQQLQQRSICQAAA